MIICIGPICVPLWHLGILCLMLIQPLLRLYRFFTGQRAQAKEACKAEGVSYSPGGEWYYVGSFVCCLESLQGGVLHIRTESDLDKLKEDAEALHLPLFVDFGAPWCGPCRRIAPVFEHLAKTHTGIFASVNVDDIPNHPDIPAALPTFKVFKKRLGRAEDMLTGADAVKLEALVTRHAGKKK